MRKGAEVIQVLGTVMIMIVTAVLTWGYITGRNEAVVSEGTGERIQPLAYQACSTDSDCENNRNGVKCYNIYSIDRPQDLSSFCGCVINEDCELGGICGQDNRCA